MRWMKTRLALSLAVLLCTAAPVHAEDTVTVHRCVDGKGRVSLQNDPCPPGSRDSVKTMLRPKDAAVSPVPSDAGATGEKAPPVSQSAPAPPDYEPLPPPPMYRCTSYDGIERIGENYDPNPRCEPLALYFPAQQLTAEQAGACRWVQDSCVRLSDAAACEVWKTRKKEAASALLHAFSDTAAYRKSELQRITQVVDESCR